MVKKKQTAPENIYGPHDIDDSRKGRSYCTYGCGCYWSRHGKKGGPIGLYPVKSLCPNNLIMGGKLPGDHDYRNVVEERIEDLTNTLGIFLDERKKSLGILRTLHLRLLELSEPPNNVDKLILNPKPIQL